MGLFSGLRGVLPNESEFSAIEDLLDQIFSNDKWSITRIPKSVLVSTLAGIVVGEIVLSEPGVFKCHSTVPRTIKELKALICATELKFLQ